MSAPSHKRTPNPHLGSYYSIFVSGLVSLAILLAMAEQLGWTDDTIMRSLILLPLMLYLAIAVATRTLSVEDFFVSGRRVPQLYNAFLLAAITVGGTGFFAYSGALFFVGFDALAIGLGWTCGLLMAGVLLVPFLRRAGAYTLPAFFGQRFESRSARITASGLQIAPTALLLAAEMKIAAMVLAVFLPMPFWLAVILVAINICAAGILGGMRSLTWSGSAQFLAGVIGLSAPLIVVSVLLTHLPAPQLTYGEMFGALQVSETAVGVVPVEPGALVPTLPQAEPQQLAKPFLQTFGAISESGFFALFLCLALGTAAMPSLLMRAGVTASVADQRRSTTWALALVALFAMTAPSLAAFAKLLMLRDMALIPTDGLPAWLDSLSQWGLVQAKELKGGGVMGAGEILTLRDGVAVMLPVLAELPHVLTVLMVMAGLSIALAASGSHLFTLAASLANDIYLTIDRRPLELPRLMACWAAILICALAAVIFLLAADFDPLHTAITAFAFAGATFFPSLMLAVWWPRCTASGALASLVTGFGICFLAAAGGGLFGVAETAVGMSASSLVAAVLALCAGVATSLYGPKPTAFERTYYEEMRRPEGEAIFDEALAKARIAAARATKD